MSTGGLSWPVRTHPTAQGGDRLAPHTSTGDDDVSDQPGSDDTTGGYQPPTNPPPPPAVPTGLPDLPPYGAPPVPEPGAPAYGAPPAPGAGPAYGAPSAPGASPAYGAPGAPGYGPPPVPGVTPGAPYGSPQYGAPVAAGAKTETTAILGLVFAFLFWPAGLVLSIVGLSKSKKNGTSGTGLAIAGLVVSILIGIVSVISTIAFIAAASKTSDALSDASRQLSSAVASAQASTAPDQSPDAGQVAAFGEGFKFEDGVQVEVSQPAAFTPSASAFTGSGQFTTYVRFDVTVTNNSTKPFTPMLMTFAATSGGVAAEDVYDMEANVTGMGPDGDVLPGSTVTFAVAYAVKDPADLQLDVSTGFDYDTVYFTSSGS